ncbi:MAG TPA: SDR family oxidoreductase [Thermoplasmata archaeon]|nr:SDR family oxidoreductase [Thermoplasmata archaeon]
MIIAVDSFINDGANGRLVDLGIRGKVALVAAASQGMGRATALVLAREGCKVAICARNEGPLQATANAIRKESGAEVLGVRADVARAEGVSAFVDAAIRSFGGVDLLVANAGGPPTGRLDELTEVQWSQAYDLTLQSSVRLARGCIPSMKARGGGSIVAITSISVKQPIENLLLSNAMRGAVVGLVKTLARELGPNRIRVNAVAPGWIATDRLAELTKLRAGHEGKTLAAAMAEDAKQIPLGRIGDPREVAEVIAFLLSEKASYLTGNIIQIDGGLYRGVH